jgi:hypothetical protein
MTAKMPVRVNSVAKELGCDNNSVCRYASAAKLKVFKLRIPDPNGKPQFQRCITLADARRIMHEYRRVRLAGISVAKAERHLKLKKQ